MSARDLLGPDGPLAHAFARYEARESQLTMADAVEHALESSELLLIEAGTGTGKTLAYLVPAILSGKRVVISTGTKTLQDQIMEHDIPLLAEHLGVAVSAACMKGLNNYLCMRRFEEFRRSSAGNDGPLSRSLPMLEAWQTTTASGDRAELSELGSDAAIWAEVHSGADTRIGSKCHYFEECYVTAMRRAAERARIIVVNHHLFFADLATRGPHGGGVIPDYDAVIFDEAHEIEDVATNFFGITVSSTRLEVLVRDATRTLAAAGVERDASGFLHDILASGSQLFASLPRPAAGDAGRVPLAKEVFDDRAREGMFALDNALDGLTAYAKRHVAESEAVAQIARRAQKIRDDVATIASGSDNTAITWTEQRGRTVTIGQSPVEIGPLMREQIFYRGIGVVLTSASLATGSSSSPFDFMKQRLGIDFEPQEHRLPSPFDFAEQAALYLPIELPDPREPNFSDVARDHIVQLTTLTDGGAFVLCTSIRSMRTLSALCRPLLPQLTLMTQGDAPNNVLLERFRENGRAVLFATASFWQGVDVPGQALRLVIIDKLPFDVPTDPLIQARCDRLKAQGIEPFMKYLVPSAALTLKQGFGRLIRTRDDRGIVAILDRRLTTKGYGKVFLRSLPDASRCQSFEEVEAFWRAGKSPDGPATTE